MTTRPRSPAGLGEPGKRLWKAIVEEFDLAPHEALQLEEACHVRDRIFSLRESVQSDGLMIPSSQGDRLHPAVAEVRQQQLTLARILATLEVPGLDEDGLPSARAVRGVYPPRTS